MLRMSAQDLAWIKAQALYISGDTVEDACIKVQENSYKIGTEAYSAFWAGFLEMINSVNANV